MAGQPHDMKQIAYDTWRGCGQNLVDTVQALKRVHNFTVTRQTLAAWRDEYDWAGRAARAEAETGKQDEICSEKGILGIMSRQIQRYTDYFDSLPVGKMDNQAGFAFASLCNSLLTNMRKGTLPVATQPSVDIRQINTPEQAITALGDAIQSKIHLVLADPLAIDLKMIKDLKSALALLDELKSKYAPEEKGSAGKGLSDEAADQIRRKILGIQA